jgi:hypothetical protein
MKVACIRSGRRLRPHLEYETARFGRYQVSLDCGRNSLKAELIPFSQSVCQRID